MLLTRRAFLRLAGGLALTWVGLTVRPSISAEDTPERVTLAACDQPPEPAIDQPIAWEAVSDKSSRDLPAEPALDPPVEWEVVPDASDGTLPVEPAIEPAIVWEQTGCSDADERD